MNKNLKIAGVVAIIIAILIIPISIFGIAGGILKESLTIKAINLTLSIILVPLSLLILMGYLIIANKNKLNFLRNMAWIFFVFIIVSSPFAILTLLYPANVSKVMALSPTIIGGILYVLFGISILGLKKRFKRLATGLGILYIIDGVFYITVLLVLLSPFIGIASSILEAVLFFRAAKKY